MQRLVWILYRQYERLGPVGLIFIGTGLAAVFFYSAVYRSSLATLNTLEKPKTKAVVVRPTMTMEDELNAFIMRFPPVNARADSVNTIFALAAKQEIALDEVTYKLERRPDDRLAHYHVDFSIVAPYTKMRAYLDALLIALPHASLDNMSMRRELSTDTNIETRVRLTLHFSTP